MKRRLWFVLWSVALGSAVLVLLLSLTVPAVTRATAGWDLVSLVLILAFVGAGLLVVGTPQQPGSGTNDPQD